MKSLTLGQHYWARPNFAIIPATTVASKCRLFKLYMAVFHPLFRHIFRALLHSKLWMKHCLKGMPYSATWKKIFGKLNTEWHKKLTTSVKISSLPLETKSSFVSNPINKPQSLNASPRSWRSPFMDHSPCLSELVPLHIELIFLQIVRFTQSSMFHSWNLFMVWLQRMCCLYLPQVSTTNPYRNQ